MDNRKDPRMIINGAFSRIKTFVGHPKSTHHSQRTRLTITAPSSSSQSQSEAETEEGTAITESSAQTVTIRMQDQPRVLRAARYSKREQLWKHTSNGANIELPLPTSVRILTWNVDFMTQNPKKRLQTVLDYIQKEVFDCGAGEKPEPCCILLQEIHAEAFHTIHAHAWIQNHFIIAPTSRQKWPQGASYGNVTLVSRLVPVSRVHTIEFSKSTMQRNALLVDLKLCAPEPHQDEMVTLRVANTHLESLPEGAGRRPRQLGLIAKALKERGLHGGIVAGDMNAIGPSDEPLPTNVGLEDAWSGEDDTDEGFTWGYQPTSKYPAGRLDKVLYVPGTGYWVEEPQTVGAGLKTPQGQWASDHYGLITTAHISSA